jgi:hypothetical protein
VAVIGERHDWLVVQLEEVAAAVRKVAATLLEVDTRADIDELDAQLDSQLDDLFDHARIHMVDSKTAATILRPPARIRGYAELLRAKSEVLRELGTPQTAGQARGLARRALELHLEAATLETREQEIDHEAIDALLDLEPPLPLGPRYQGILEGLLRDR